MTENLQKLIEQYPGDQKEIMEYVQALSTGRTSREVKLYKFLKYFAPRPTCGEEQRKFLNEVETFRIERGLGVFCENEAIYLSKNIYKLDLDKVFRGE